jgi:hypothetical protein
MPKRINLTLSDDAIARLQDVPYHLRGAHVSALIVGAPLWEQSREKPRCKCGLELSSRVLAEHGLWAADDSDVTAYKGRQQPAHDVIAGNGKRLRVGACHVL